MAQAVADALWRWSDGGALPIVVDAASCTLGIKEDVVTQLEGKRKEQFESLKIVDSITWCRDLLPKLAISRTLRRVAVHPTCSITQLGLTGARLAQPVAALPATGAYCIPNWWFRRHGRFAWC
jgi:D-lactate dehydrogenase